MKLFCEARSRQWFLLGLGIVLAGVGGYALWYTLRRPPVLRGDGVRDSGILLGGAVAVLALRFFLVLRPRRDWLEIDPVARVARLVLGGVEHSSRPLAGCGPVRVNELWSHVRSKRGGATTLTSFEVWLVGFPRPVFTSGGRVAAQRHAAALAAACGVAVEQAPGRGATEAARDG